jgi:hypothetical protein
MRSCLPVLLLTASALGAAAPPPPLPGARRAAALVRQLGGDDSAQREAAEEKLLEIGPAAVKAVRRGLKSRDAEVRARCRRLLPRLEQQVWERKADAYLADRSGKRRQGLPLLAEFEKLAGTDPPARKLYAAILRTTWRVLREVQADRKRGLDAYRGRCREVHALIKGRSAEAPARVGEVAGLLFASAVLKKDAPEWADMGHAAHLLGSAGLRKAVKDPTTGKALRRLLVAWAGGRSVEEVVSLQYFLYFVQDTGLKEGLPLVRRLIRDGRAARINVRAVAVAVLADVGGKQAAAQLKKLWASKDLLAQFQKGRTALLGDQALAVSLRRARKKPADYGLRSLTVLLKTPGGSTRELSIYWFDSDEDRRKALKKWGAEEKAPRR